MDGVFGSDNEDELPDALPRNAKRGRKSTQDQTRRCLLVSRSDGPRREFTLPEDFQGPPLPCDCLLGIALVRWDLSAPGAGCLATQALARACESRPGRPSPDYHLEYSIVNVNWIGPQPYHGGSCFEVSVPHECAIFWVTEIKNRNIFPKLLEALVNDPKT